MGFIIRFMWGLCKSLFGGLCEGLSMVYTRVYEGMNWYLV